MTNKKIMFTCAGYGGGIGKMIRFVSSSCLANSYEVSIVHRNRETVNDYIPNGIKEIVIPKTSDNSIKWRIDQILDLRRTIQREQPHIVCCFGSEQAVMVSIAMWRIKNIKIVLCERGDPYSLNIVWKYLVKWAYAKADYCIFQLEKQRAWFGNIIKSNYSIIPNPYISTGVFKSFSGTREKKIVSVGRFVFEKRYEVLIEAFKKVHDRHPEYTLIIWGEGPYRERYENLINSLSLQEYCKMPGLSRNSMEDIKSASVFVLSSIYEGIPNTLIEALAAGVPSVSTDCTPGGPEFLTNHGERGLLVPTNDIDSLANAICKIIENPFLSEELSKKSVEILDVLDKDRIKNMWIDAFNKLIGV